MQSPIAAHQSQLGQASSERAQGGGSYKLGSGSGYLNESFQFHGCIWFMVYQNPDAKPKQKVGPSEQTPCKTREFYKYVQNERVRNNRVKADVFEKSV